jgi:hypothetical protein
VRIARLAGDVQDLPGLAELGPYLDRPGDAG